jgi:hypothetical protein
MQRLLKATSAAGRRIYRFAASGGEFARAAQSEILLVENLPLLGH